MNEAIVMEGRAAIDAARAKRHLDKAEEAQRKAGEAAAEAKAALTATRAIAAETSAHRATADQEATDQKEVILGRKRSKEDDSLSVDHFAEIDDRQQTEDTSAMAINTGSRLVR